MTSILGRLTGTAEPEVPMTIPRHGSPSVPGASQVPWFTGVPVLDPDVSRFADWEYAAECVAIACGVYVLGADAGRTEWLRGHMKSPVRKWAEWLGSSQADMPKRALALRMLCERAGTIHPDNILSVAQSICSAGTLR